MRERYQEVPKCSLSRVSQSVRVAEKLNDIEYIHKRIYKKFNS